MPSSKVFPQNSDTFAGFQEYSFLSSNACISLMASSCSMHWLEVQTTSMQPSFDCETWGRKPILTNYITPLSPPDTCTGCSYPGLSLSLLARVLWRDRQDLIMEIVTGREMWVCFTWDIQNPMRAVSRMAHNGFWRWPNLFIIIVFRVTLECWW